MHAIGPLHVHLAPTIISRSDRPEPERSIATWKSFKLAR
jgi:hypothetical protein